MNPNSTSHKFPWINTSAKTILFLLKNRIKAPRVVPAPSTGDPATDDATRREFERVKEQLNADYQDQRAALTDLEPLVYEVAEQLQGWMTERETRLADREERMMNLLLTGMRGQSPGMPAGPGMSQPSSAALPGSVPAQLSSQAASTYEGQLVRGDGTDAVYKIEGGRKRWVTSPDAMTRNGFQWADVRVLPRPFVDNMPFGSNIS